MKTNVIVGGLMAVLGATWSASLLADEAPDANKGRAGSQESKRSAEQTGAAQPVKSQRRERVRYTFPPTKR